MFKYIPLLLIFLWSCSNQPTRPTASAMKFGATATAKAESANIVIENGTLDTLQYYTIPVTRTAIYNYAYDSFYVVRHKYVKPTVPVDPPPVVTPPTTGYITTYSNGYDKKTDLDFVHEQLGFGQISTTEFKTGLGSFKGIVNVGDPSISSGFRSENQYMDASQNPKEGAVEYDWKLESLTPVSWGGDIGQWHPGGSDNGGSALFFMEAAQGVFNMYCWKKGYYTSYGTPAKITYGKWYDIRYEFLWSLKADGYWRVYIDGKLYWSYTGATQISNDQPYLKIGWNFFSGSSNQKTSVHGGVAYWDNLVIQKRNQ